MIPRDTFSDDLHCFHFANCCFVIVATWLRTSAAAAASVASVAINAAAPWLGAAGDFGPSSC